MKGFETLVTLEELKKYLKIYALSENNRDSREFALELLIKLERGVKMIDLPFGAAQSPESVPSVGRDTSIPG